MNPFPPARALLLVAAAVAHASLSVSPQLVETRLPRGARKTLFYTVVNEDTENERTVRYYPVPYRQKVNGAYAVTGEPDHDFSSHEWFEPDTTELVLGPGKGKEVGVSIRVPADAAGTNYGAVAFEMVPLPAKEVWSVGLAMRIPAFVEVTVIGAGRPVVELAGIRFLSVEELQARVETDAGAGVLSTVIDVRNPGPVSAPIRGRLLVRDDKGRRYREFPLGGGGTVLPGAQVEVLSAVPMPRDGGYTLEVSLDYGGLVPVRATRGFRVAGGQVRVEGDFVELPQLPVEFNKETVDLNVPPRSTRFDYLVLRNLGTSDVRLGIAVKGLAGDGEGGLVPTDSPAGPNDCRNWVGLDSANVTIPPNATRAIRVEFSTPEEASGGNYASLVFSPLDSGPGKAVDPFVIPVMLNVTGRSEPGAEAVESRVSADPVAVGVRVANTGNVHLETKGSCRLRRATVESPASSHDYEAAGEFELSDAGIVLPGDTLLVSGRYVGLLRPGRYLLDVTVDCGSGVLLRKTESVKVN